MAKFLIGKIIPDESRSRLRSLYFSFLRFLLAPWFDGFKFKCPFCGGRFRKLLPFGFDFPVLKEKQVVGGGLRSNAMCPRCGSFDRERLLYLYLRNKTNVFKEDLRMLHVAPEKNLQRVLLESSNIDYLSADIESPLAMVKIDLTDTSFKNGSFDIIICSHVLEHVQDDRKAMLELFRVLKPSGWAILQVPISRSLEETIEDQTVREPAERERLFGQRDHVRIYARDYKTRLEGVGFKVEVYNFTEELGEAIFKKYGLIKDESLYICSKAKREDL